MAKAEGLLRSPTNGTYPPWLTWDTSCPVVFVCNLCRERVGIAYVIDWHTFHVHWGTLGVRSLLALPGHVIFATTWGYALGRQKIDPTYRVWPMVALAALLHGLYDFLLMYGPTRPLILLYMSLMVPVIVRQIRLLRADSPFAPGAAIVPAPAAAPRVAASGGAPDEGAT